jgi:thymidylate synthase
MKIEVVEATTIPDAWYQCLNKLFREPHREYLITRGSYKGQWRREFDHITVQIKNPGASPLPLIPESYGVPSPTSEEYINQYLLYLMTDAKSENEQYTYGERIVNPKAILGGKEIPFGINPLEKLIEMYKKDGHGTNQAVLEIGMPSDIILDDPPCLRTIDTKIKYGALHFILNWRSWDLFGGFLTNLGGLQQLKQHIANEVGVEDGEIIANCSSLHVYDHLWGASEAVIQTDRNIEGVIRE